MKILRIRRGYTTNSSGANEWVPPSPTATTASTTSTGAGAAIASTTGAGGSTSEGEASTATTAPSPDAARRPPDRTGSNLGQLGCLGALVLLFTAFGWRLSRRRLPQEADED